MSLPTITIMTPIYNHGEFIVRCAESVFNQTFKSWEWLIIDDGSTDNTIEKVQEILCDKISFYSRNHLGIFKSWAECIELADADLVTFMCADDLIEPEFLKVFHHVLMSNKCDVVVGDFMSILENENKQGRSIWNPKPYGWGYLGCAMLIKRNLLKECWYKEDPPVNDEGCTVWGRILLSDAKIGYVKEPLYTHIRTGNCFGARSTNEFMDRPKGGIYLEEIFSPKQLNIITSRFGKYRARYG